MCVAESIINSVIHISSRRDLMRQPEIGENIQNKSSFNNTN